MIDDQSVESVENFILEARKQGTSQDVITQQLLGAGWTQDIINQAMISANEKNELDQNDDLIKTKENIEQAQTTNEQAPDIFTKPPAEITGAQPQPKKEIVEKKRFSIWNIIALLLSPIPFIGLSIAMFALENNRKKKLSGSIVSIIALIINLVVIGFILWAIYQIFTFDHSQLTGFSKFIVEKFDLL